MKIALLEVSHWHFPLYIDALMTAVAKSGAEIIGVSDRDKAIRETYGNKFGCPAYAEWRGLLGETEPDTAFAFGRHREMPEIGRALIGLGIPFAIEKPAGLGARDVAALRQEAEAAGVQVAVPLVQRVGPLQALLDRLIDEEGAAFTSTAWRFNAGPPSRYLSSGNGWMLDPNESGGGCLMNLGAHFVDLALSLLPGPPNQVFGHVDTCLHGAAVEDTALVTMTSPGGGRALVETGYNFPDGPGKREYSFSLASRSHYVQTRPGGVAIFRPGKAAEEIDMNLDADLMYGIFAETFLGDLAAGRKLSPTLSDLEPAIRIIDAAYQSSRDGQVVNL
ncbi:MAG: Gfo/Idh/MocA family oxidoreductase [Rhodospirillaceae bacterium]|nr:Gfo/Idh/MocA family oxidoreductase [Rhodospirillaceae bacterium]